MGLIARLANRMKVAFEKRPDGTVHAASVMVPFAQRTWTELTPEQALAAMQSAQQGNIRQACDFCDQLLTDDRIAGVLDTRVLGMLGLPMFFEGPELSEWWDLAPEGELARIMIWGLLLGVSFAHIEADGSLRWWHPRSFRFDRSKQAWFVTHSEGCEELCAEEWLIYEPYGATDSALAGLWVSLSLPVLIKLFSLHDQARASEVFGSAMVIGKAPEGSTEPQRKQWLNDLKALARSTRMVLPDQYDIKLLEAQGQTWGIYKQSIEWADNAITIRLAGQLVTTVGSSGFSRGDVHEKITRSLLRFGEQTFSSCLAKRYVPYVWGVKCVPRWQTTSPDELIGEGQALTNLAAGITAMSTVLAGEKVELDVEGYVKRFGVMVKPRAIETPGLQLVAARAPMGRAICASTIIPEARRDEFRIFKMGANKSDYGTVYYTRESALLIMRQRGNRDVMIDLEHLSLDPEAPNFDPNARGWARLQAREDGLYAIRVRWTEDGASRIDKREQRGISPVFGYRKKDKVIVSLHNLALTAMPATHDGVILIAASQRGNMPTLLQMLGLPPEATIQDVIAALGLDASATAEDVLAAIATAFEAAAGDGADDGAAADDTAAAADDSNDDDEDKTAAATAPKSGAKPKLRLVRSGETVSTPDAVSARLSALEKAEENRERTALIASRAFKPWEVEMLTAAPIDTVRTYVKNAPKAAPKVAAEVEPGETQVSAQALSAVAQALGRKPDKLLIAKQKKGAV